MQRPPREVAHGRESRKANIVHFDPVKGRPEGDPFRVTNFHSPDLMVADVIADVGLSLTEDKLIVTAAQRSGSIWILDDMDR
jgi:hypothetical protein